jgi:heme/copper-type cytochrome/quinol oxidase subunit 2
MFQDLLKETWFIATLICGIGGAVWIVLCVLGVWLYKCRHRNKKLKAGGKST